MNLRILLSLCVIFLQGAAWCAAATFDELGKRVAGYEPKELPTSAYKVVEEIAAKAGRERHKGQQMAALLYGCRLRQRIVPDSFYTDMQRLERLKNQTADGVHRAVLASVLGELYAGNAWRTRNRSARTDAHPDSIREWSYAQFMKAAASNYALSMSAPGELAAARAADYMPFVSKGRDAFIFDGDLLNVVGRRAAEGLRTGEASETMSAAGVYGRMLVVYRARGNREAELFVMLDSLDKASGHDGKVRPDLSDQFSPEEREHRVLRSEPYLTYRNMLSRFGDLPQAAEIYLRMLSLGVTPCLKVAWATEGYAKYKAWPQAARLLDIAKELENPEISVEFPGTLYSGMPFDCVVRRRHMEGAQWKWYLLPDKLSEHEVRNFGSGALLDYAVKHGRVVSKGRFEGKTGEPFEQLEDTFRMETPAPGRYAFTVVPDGLKGRKSNFVQAVGVSRMMVVVSDMPDSSYLCTVVDARTGSPVPAATVELYDDAELYRTAVTDYDGKARVPYAAAARGERGRRNWRVRAVKGADRYMVPVRFHSQYVYNENRENVSSIRLYTDRSVYRPGQTVYVGGLCTVSRRAGERVEAGRKVTFFLRDANNRTVAEQTAVSDEMGTVSVSFTLPAKGLAGRYSVYTEQGAAYFTMEEYKRPTFEVTLEPLADGFRQGDTVRLSGTAMGYNGVPLRQARVTAGTRVLRFLYRASGGGAPAEPLDTVYTDGQGRFTLAVPVQAVDAVYPVWGMRQQVDVAVMSAAGETQTAEALIPLTREKMSLSVFLPGHCVKESLPELKAEVRTAAGTEWKDPVTVTADLFRTKEGRAHAKVMSGIALPAGREVRLAELVDLPSGSYELVARAVSGADTVETRSGFVLFSLSDKRPADGMKDWFYCVSDSVTADAPACIQVGSGADSVSLYYQLYCKNELVEEKVCHFSDSVLTFTYTEIPEDADGLYAMFYFVKEGELFTHGQSLVKRKPGKTLRMSWTSFRDKLRPGMKETWKLRVTLPDGKPASAQMMAAMYDASLDGIRSHGWGFRPSFRDVCLPYVNMNMWLRGPRSFYYSAPLRHTSVRGLQFDRFNMPGGIKEVFYSVEGLQIVNDEAPLMAASATGVNGLGAMRMMKSEAKVRMDEVAENTEEAGEDVEEEKPRVPVRENMNETAFFYPRLMTDAEGEVTISFTLPESLTTWQFLALAHTQDMYAGIFTDRVVAAKDVMAQLNLPRFVRKGDRAILSVTLHNLTEHTLAGRVTMEVFDPATGKTLWKEKQDRTLGAGAGVVADFTYVPSGEVSLPVCRVLFESEGHSDGEQRYLPVLEDKEWLTQTLPFAVSHKEDTVLRLDGLFQRNNPEADFRKLTVEYTANPLWYAVQALPSVLEPRTDDVLSLGAAYYASVLSSRLSVRFPQLKTAADLWRREIDMAESGALTSNAGLAGLVKEETPWVADAEAEARRLQGLQQLFDANRQADLRGQFAASLGKLQLGDGSFCWFGGMKGNMWLTQRVARMLLRSGAGKTADPILAQHVDVRRMMKYLTVRIREEVEKDKKYLDEHKTYLYGGAYWMDYLYLVTLCEDSWFDASARRDVGYMLSRLLADRSGLSVPDKAEAAVVFRGMGKDAEAAQMARSIREYLVNDADGLHIEYPSNGFVTSSRKIAVHVSLMDALRTAEETEEADGLCRWLLSQKRLQDWGTSAGSMDAVYALLQGRSRELTWQQEDEIVLTAPGGKELARMSTAESQLTGLGTVTVSVGGDALKKGAGRLAVHRKEKYPSSWGAVYASFRLPLDQVESSAAGLRVRCEVSVSSPKKGDRVTLRYVITSDRDYEYVCLKAGRAACLEPVDARSGYEYGNGLGYYKEVKDASTNYFFERLPKGTYVLETECYVERPGRYSVGASKLNGLYAPEFSAYDAGQILEVSE